VGAHQEGAALNERHSRHLAFARLFSSAVLSQALLSAANFAAGMLLLRNANAGEYGYYVLAFNGILLLVSLQGAFLGPPLSIRLHLLAPAERSRLVGGLHFEQTRIVAVLTLLALPLVIGLNRAGLLGQQLLYLILVAIVAALAVLYREYFRMVLLAYRRSHAVLGVDTLHVLLLLAGICIASLTAAPAIAAVGALTLAAVISGTLLLRILRQNDEWRSGSVNGLLRDIAPVAAWSTGGAAVHWAYTQGYIYLVAGTLGMTAVAAVAATRLLMMPVNLLSTGIGSLMLPVTAGWLHKHGPGLVLRRLCLLAAGMVIATCCYFLVLWVLRDWIFASVLHKDFGHRDHLLMMWGAIFLLIVIRDQLIYLPAAQGRFHTLTLLALFGALVALAAGYWGIAHSGLRGALLGPLAGELVSVIGMVILSARPVLQQSNGIPAATAAFERNSP
jgi:O-antigen/teichoic acid export membrane protein